MLESEKLFEMYILAETFCSQADFSITFNKLKTLFLINKYQPASAQLLLSKTGQIKSNFSACCKELVKDGYIMSKKGSQDRRNRTYLITADGALLLEEYFSKLETLLRAENLQIDGALEILNKKV